MITGLVMSYFFFSPPDTVFFHLPSRDPSRKTVYCVSCYRQMDAKVINYHTCTKSGTWEMPKWGLQLLMWVEYSRLGEKLFLKHFVLVEVCWNFKGWFGVVLVHPRDRGHSEGKSMRSFMISNWAEVNYDSDMFPFPLTHPSLTFFLCKKCRALTIGAVKHH